MIHTRSCPLQHSPKFLGLACHKHGYEYLHLALVGQCLHSIHWNKCFYHGDDLVAADHSFARCFRGFAIVQYLDRVFFNLFGNPAVLIWSCNTCSKASYTTVPILPYPLRVVAQKRRSADSSTLSGILVCVFASCYLTSSEVSSFNAIAIEAS